MPVPQRPKIVNADPALRLPEAAAYLRVCTKTLRRHIKAKRLKATRLGNQVLAIRQSELERFLNASAA